jgi:hypothetical protein
MILAKGSATHLRRLPASWYWRPDLGRRTHALLDRVRELVILLNTRSPEVRCGSSNQGVFESTFRRMRKGNNHGERAADALRSDGGRARARHFGLLGGDEL